MWDLLTINSPKDYHEIQQWVAKRPPMYHFCDTELLTQGTAMCMWVWMSRLMMLTWGPAVWTLALDDLGVF